jgi:WD40 repeat protein
MDAPLYGLGSSGRLFVAAATGKQHLRDAPHEPSGHPGDATLVVWKDGKLQSRLRESGVTAKRFALEVDPGETRVACGGDGTIHIVDLATGRQTVALAGHRGAVRAIGWSADGARIASGGDDGSVRYWDALSGGLLSVLHEQGAAVTDVELSRDGSLLACSFRNGTAKVLSLAGNTGWTLPGHDSPVNSVAFDRDGKFVATGSEDGRVRVFHARTSERRLDLSGHRRPVKALGFHTDGRRLASLSDDGAIRIWDLATGRELLALRTGSGMASRLNVASSPGSWRLAFGPNEGALAAVIFDKPYWFPAPPWQGLAP